MGWSVAHTGLPVPTLARGMAGPGGSERSRTCSRSHSCWVAEGPLAPAVTLLLSSPGAPLAAHAELPWNDSPWLHPTAAQPVPWEKPQCPQHSVCPCPPPLRVWLKELPTFLSLNFPVDGLMVLYERLFQESGNQYLFLENSMCSINVETAGHGAGDHR